MAVGLTLERALQGLRSSPPPAAVLEAATSSERSRIGISDADSAFLGVLLEGAETLGRDADDQPGP
jgi:hypothetical protein